MRKITTFAAMAAALGVTAPVSAATLFTGEGVAQDGTLDINFGLEGPSLPVLDQRARYTVQFDRPVQNLIFVASSVFTWYFEDGFEDGDVVDIPYANTVIFESRGPVDRVSLVVPTTVSQTYWDEWGANAVPDSPTATYSFLGAYARFDDNGPVGYRFSAALVPEPATWALFILGFGAIGFAMRTRRRNLRIAYT